MITPFIIVKSYTAKRVPRFFSKRYGISFLHPKLDAKKILNNTKNN